MAIRTQCAIDALQDVCAWLENGGEVAVSGIIIINIEYSTLLEPQVYKTVQLCRLPTADLNFQAVVVFHVSLKN